ncbi:MAG: class I SAM-dependent methyltransferase [Paludibacteraceae bacterium]|nr:class I SAM-dependent methyltransferase [Paludibacteraceae bacterium]MBN2787261.1 class I SAM-dependent methyltransferase [Paludibacteraceae bacterium]
MNYNDLEKYVHTIYKIVGNKTIINETISNKVVSNYYSKSAFLYKTFHSKEGAMHFPVKLSEETSHKQKLLYQAETILEVIRKNNYSEVLELGCGMGFNCNYMASKSPNCKFVGIDLTPSNIQFAQQKSKGLNNVSFYQMNFDKMHIPDKKFDLIVAIETLCHSKNVVKLLNNLPNYLTDNGKIILFDGYIKQGIVLENKYEKEAYQLLSWGFALATFQKLGVVTNPQNFDQLKIDTLTEFSENVLPNAIAFQKGALKAIRFATLLKLLLKTKLISLAYIKQISAGLFGAYFLKTGYLGYYQLELSVKP